MAEEAPKPRRTRTRRTPKAQPVEAEAPAEPTAEVAAAPAETVSEEAVKPKRTRARRTAKAKPVEAPTTEEGNILQPVNIDEVAPTKRRAGWWKR
ncbi:hypothetical protein [Gluconobacter oxydans]|uniref:hypothetical protein n=1 Tax=Gluconobacter oxydans TaxID=442 RepID=UPI0038CD28DB